MQKPLTQFIKPKSLKENKSKKLKQKCVNAFNDYYYEHFIELSQKAAVQKQIYSQIIPLRNIASSIKKYPYPILSLEQAGSLQGIGEHYIGHFKKLINNYKTELKEKKIDYVKLAYSVKPELGEPNLKRKRERSQKSVEINNNSKKVISFSNPGTKKASQLKEIKAEAKKLKFKNNLININLYSSVWTTAVCCYIAFFDKESYDIDYSKIIEFGKILKNKFDQYNIKIEEPNLGEDKTDIEELKNLKLIESVKKNKITINDYLIKLVKIELSKIGISIKKDNLNGVLEYNKFEIEQNIDKNNKNYINNGESNDVVKNKLLEEYIDFIKFQKNDENNKDIDNNNIDNNNEVKDDNNDINSTFSDNIYLIVDLREKGAGNENFRVEILNKLHHPIPIEEKNLSLGDFTWIYKDQLDGEEYMLDFIIERKTLNDLSASILDGRYNEQKYRLKNSPYKNIYYLFEGTELNIHNNSNLSKDAINTAINNTINIHDIKFYRTFSTKDTVNKLIELDSNIRKSFNFLKDKDGKKITYKKYIENFAKTKNSTVEEIFLRQLRCFEHCGKKCVEILNNCFQTQLSFYKLIQGLKKKKVDEKNMENVIACCYYLHENKKDINVQNILKCFENIDEIEKFKKDIFFSKLFRKLAVIEMLNYYCFYNEDKNILEGEINFNNKNKDIKNINNINDKELFDEKKIDIIDDINKNDNKKNNRNNSRSQKKTKKTKNKIDVYSNNNIEISNDLNDDSSFEIEKKKKKCKKKKEKKEKSKDKKRKNKIKKDNEIELNKEKSDEYCINKKNISMEENNNNNNDNINDSKIKESFKHLEDIGSEQDFNNFEY